MRGRRDACPGRLDVEVSAQWTPVGEHEPARATCDHDERARDYGEPSERTSASYGLSEKSARHFSTRFSRVDADPMTTGDREIGDGVGFASF
jgi:hypothetical protein